MDDQRVLEDFRKYTVGELKKFLSDRKVRADGKQAELAVLAYWVWKLKLPVNPSELQTQRYHENRLREQMTLHDGSMLPLPNTITDWTKDLKRLPQVEYPDLYHYLIHTPGYFTHETLKARKSLESWNFYICGFVNELEIHKVSDTDFCFVKSTVRRSQAGTDPYPVWVCIHQEDAWIKAARCQCMAGLGEACSHIAALLYKAVAATDAGLNSKEGPTDIRCAWNDSFKETVQPSLVKDIDFSKPEYGRTKRPLPVQQSSPSGSSSNDDSEDESLFELIKEAAPNAAVLCVLKSDTTIEEELDEQAPPMTVDVVPLDNVIKTASTSDEAFHNVRHSIDDATSLEIEKQTRRQNASELWHFVRNYRITASKCHSIYKYMLKVPHGGTSSKSHERLVSSVRGDNTFSETNLPLPIRWGRDMENVAAISYYETEQEVHTNLTMTEAGIMIPPGKGHIGASPDRILNCDCHGIRILEIKCPFSARDCDIIDVVGSKVKYLEYDGEDTLQLKNTHQYYTQIQAQLNIFGCNSCDLFVFSPKGSCIVHVEVNKIYWDAVEEKLSAFYQQFVIPSVREHPGESSSNILTSQTTSDQPQQPSEPPSDPGSKRRRKQVKWPCGICMKDASTESIGCDNCANWYHFTCVNLTGNEEFLSTDDWFCNNCI